MQACAVLGISPPATSLRSWTAAGLRVLHEAIFGDAEHRGINLNFFEIKPHGSDLLRSFLPVRKMRGQAFSVRPEMESGGAEWFGPLPGFPLCIFFSTCPHNRKTCNSSMEKCWNCRFCFSGPHHLFFIRCKAFPPHASAARRNVRFCSRERNITGSGAEHDVQKGERSFLRKFKENFMFRILTTTCC